MKYDAGANAYDGFTGRWSRLFVPAVLAAAGVGPASRVLDVATGTGDAVVAAAAQSASGFAVGIDISLPMLHVARGKCAFANVALVGGSALALPFADRTFDAAACQFGLMFFPDRVAGLREIRRTLIPGARLALTAWAAPECVAFAGPMAKALALELPAQREELLQPFSLADPETIADLLRAAGFRHVIVEHVRRPARFDTVADLFEPFEQGGGRLGQFYLQLAPAARAATRTRVLADLGLHARSGSFATELDAHLACGVA